MNNKRKMKKKNNKRKKKWRCQGKNWALGEIQITAKKWKQTGEGGRYNG
jgi:hypothetical protein